MTDEFIVSRLQDAEREEPPSWSQLNVLNCSYNQIVEIDESLVPQHSLSIFAALPVRTVVSPQLTRISLLAAARACSTC
jgi:hypothetical protein